MNHFATNLQHLLGLHRCTQQRAAELVGTSRTTIANWSSGSKEPSLSKMIKLAEVFEIDPVRFTQLPFIELLEDLLDVERFIRVEARIYDENQPALQGGNVLPLNKSSS